MTKTRTKTKINKPVRKIRIDSHPKEKCGIVAVWDANNNAPYLARLALAALQHRGLESAGVSIFTPKNKIVTYKGMGLVPHVLTDSVLTQLGPSKIATGQNRYGTSGESSFANAQPIDIASGKYQITVGHNGNLPDISNLRRLLGKQEKPTSDTTLMAKLLVKERPSFKNWEETLIHTLPLFVGAYNLTILTEDGSIFAARDPFGIRPLCLGRLPNGWIIASESVSLDTSGAEFIRDIAPGELIKIDRDGKLNSYFFGEPKRHKFCIFEYIYFARPDSFMNGRRIKAGRERSGMLLAQRIKKKNLKPDIVIPVFDSGYPAAKGVSKELGLPLVDAITTSHYIGRTFITPGQEKRVAAVGGKHNVVADEVIGKKVVVVDDSAVRLTTSFALARELKKAGATEIYMAFASPPVVDQCDMGIDMRSKKELPAAKFENEPFEVIEKNIARHIAVDQAIYLPIEDTALAMGGKKEDFYYTPFGGPHPIRDKQSSLPKRRRKIAGKPKICIFLSGGGTNLQEIINGVENKDIDAEIISVISNKEDAYGLKRAKKHNIPTIVLPYKAKLSDKKARSEYEELLIKEVSHIKPDLIVLAGWMMVLGDKFVKETQKMEIPIINLHPALMTQTNEETIQTSRGRIPVLRGWGMNIIKPPFEKNFLVSGVTVHQILPGNNFDVGPIIMKSEIRRKPEDTIESWEKKIHDTEYMLLPTALKRVIHVMKNNIDISKGEFVW
ncbi:MAG TPA: formyltransferase family protein [Xanthomonadales bacterium]|nr:formyltransferase family protein [Xanthomonadales bacterium]